MKRFFLNIYYINTGSKFIEFNVCLSQMFYVKITPKLISCVKEIRAASNYYLFFKPLEKLGANAVLVFSLIIDLQNTDCVICSHCIIYVLYVVSQVHIFGGKKCNIQIYYYYHHHHHHSYFKLPADGPVLASETK